MEEIKTDLEGHIADLSQELAASRKAAEKQAAERTAALQVWVQSVQVVLLCMQQLGTLGKKLSTFLAGDVICVSSFLASRHNPQLYERCMPSAAASSLCNTRRQI